MIVEGRFDSKLPRPSGPIALSNRTDLRKKGSIPMSSKDSKKGMGEYASDPPTSSPSPLWPTPGSLIPILSDRGTKPPRLNFDAGRISLSRIERERSTRKGKGKGLLDLNYDLILYLCRFLDLASLLLLTRQTCRYLRCFFSQLDPVGLYLAPRHRLCLAEWGLAASEMRKLGVVGDPPVSRGKGSGKEGEQADHQHTTPPSTAGGVSGSKIWETRRPDRPNLPVRRLGETTGTGKEADRDDESRRRGVGGKGRRWGSRGSRSFSYYSSKVAAFLLYEPCSGELVMLEDVLDFLRLLKGPPPSASLMLRGHQSRGGGFEALAQAAADTDEAVVRPGNRLRSLSLVGWNGVNGEALAEMLANEPGLADVETVVKTDRMDTSSWVLFSTRALEWARRSGEDRRWSKVVDVSYEYEKRKFEQMQRSKERGKEEVAGEGNEAEEGEEEGEEEEEGEGSGTEEIHLEEKEDEWDWNQREGVQRGGCYNTQAILQVGKLSKGYEGETRLKGQGLQIGYEALCIEVADERWREVNVFSRLGRRYDEYIGRMMETTKTTTATTTTSPSSSKVDSLGGVDDGKKQEEGKGKRQKKRRKLHVILQGRYAEGQEAIEVDQLFVRSLVTCNRCKERILF
ncbi:hypothetical protein IE53DRAFT_389264 [Violaceomyces palustris]|uniref:Uncharacterized protein n=1 Tax=Violaceomyces palustris TaxID=1673888 RepID=A0ACD0NRT1_9BASI|nr:hypothetical protein IE53DRAFT_389264 [Violaceomyces palustris]